MKDEYGESPTKKQTAGIRQGCPLSPYLFIMVMTCIDYDIKQLISSDVTQSRIPNVNFDLVYYADDTILFSRRAYALRELLKLTEVVSAKYGLALNRGKCVTINMNSDDDEICFEDGIKLNSVNEATYLGNDLNKKADFRMEINNKKQEVRKTWFKLSKYWKAKKCQ